MRQLWHHLIQLWQSNRTFKLAAAYLLLLFILVLLLPWLPLPYAPNYLDFSNSYIPPFTPKSIQTSHFLGTDGLGRDILSNVLYGARSAFFISIPVMTIATILGTGIGISAGYFGDKALQLYRYQVLVLVCLICVLMYYGVYIPIQIAQYSLPYTYTLNSLAVLVVLIIAIGILAICLARYSYWKKSIPLPFNWMVVRLMEALNTIPRFVLILVLASFMPPSVLLLSLLLIFTVWTSSARLARAEMLRIKQLPYFEAARSMGIAPHRLIWRHALPNLLGPVLVAFTFGVGSLLALESTLSFLNIGLPTTFVSWGRTISNIRSNSSAWWLVALPGGLLTTTVLAIYTCSHYFTKIIGSKIN